MAEGSSPGQLRLNGAARSVIIVYGIAAYTYLFPQPGAATGAMAMLLVGIGLQVLLLLVRYVVKGELAPTAQFIFELLADGVTVLLFALATYQGILRHAAEI